MSENEESVLSKEPDATVLNTDWRESLTADYRGHEHVQQYEGSADGLNKFVKTAIHAQEMMGRKGVIPPGENATIEDFATYYKQLGRPTDRTTYSADDFEKVELPEDLPRDETFEASMLQEIYDSGATPYQAERIFKAYLQKSAEQWQGLQQLQADADTDLDKQLQEEFGLAKESRIEAAREAWIDLIGNEEEALEVLNQPLANGRRVGDMFPLIKALAKVAKERSEDSLHGPKSPFAAKTPEEGKAVLSSLMADPDFLEAWTTQGHPGHAEAQRRFEAASLAANAR